MNRRSVLQLFGSVPVVGPSLARKLAAEETASKLAKIGTSGLQYRDTSPPVEHYHPTLDQKRIALQIPWFRTELEQLIAERNRHVNVIDADLTVLRSVSLSAKIYYQRQRNIQRDLRHHTEAPAYERIDRLFSGIKKLLG